MPYVSNVALEEARCVLTELRSIYGDAKEIAHRVDVLTLETETPGEEIFRFDEQATAPIIDELVRYGTYTVHRSIEVESATWSRVDIDEAGDGFDVVAHATSWKGRADMLAMLLESAVVQLTNNVESMERSMGRAS